MALDIKQQADRCAPSEPAPQIEEQEYCEGTIKMQCCCPRLQTRSWALSIGPQNTEQARAFVQNTAQTWEANGYIVLAYGITDIGGGWLLTLTVGYYV